MSRPPAHGDGRARQAGAAPPGGDGHPDAVGQGEQGGDLGGGAGAHHPRRGRGRGGEGLVVGVVVAGVGAGPHVGRAHDLGQALGQINSALGHRPLRMHGPLGRRSAECRSRKALTCRWRSARRSEGSARRPRGKGCRRRRARPSPTPGEVEDQMTPFEPDTTLLTRPAVVPVPRSDERGRTALVTGASGHVGVNLVRRLSEQGWQVRTYSRRPFEVRGVDGVEHVPGDVCDPSATREAMEGVDVVFNLAAKIALRTRDDEAWAINAEGPATVARSTLDAGVGRLVHCSSVQAFDVERAHPVLDETSPGPARTARCTTAARRPARRGCGR